jgi:hypothetical protein
MVFKEEVMAQKLNKEKLVELVGNVLSPKGRGFTSQQIDDQLLLVCINCPDPVAAMDLIIGARRPVTAADLVDKALSFPSRAVADVPEAKLSRSHPLRRMSSELA